LIKKTNIALVTINHPDIGALKRSIESNAQRKVTIVKPNAINSLKDYNVLILYQPTAVFKAVLTRKSAGISTLLLLEPPLISHFKSAAKYF
jgi:hypothetical protein